ncbi:MAG: sulfatase-like hydrolase/transferase [Proteobacteria bacterium]|nr:sulfatase-like hydrolase/transferase [Pseudomonadota bacterium]
MTTFFKTFLSFFVIALAHRGLSIDYLGSGAAPSPSEFRADVIVGMWSDLWVSVFMATPIFLIEFFALSSRKYTPRAAAAWLGIWVILTAGHQNYVEFFRHGILPFHLSYLVDKSFLAANGSSFFSQHSAVILAVGTLGVVFILFRSTPKAFTKTAILKSYTGIAVLGITCHAANIRWRVQWFVPENLQAHYLEHLYAGLSTKKPPRSLDPTDLKLLRSVTGAENGARLRRELTPRSRGQSKEITLFQEKVSLAREEGRTPIIVLLLSESFRPADAGWTRGPNDAPSLTPNLDSLAGSGILFKAAFSSGPVTRAGQEASWCGVPTGTNTSLMRSFAQFKTPCISDLGRNAGSEVLWIHGGDSRFDNQESFWRTHGVSSFVLKSDFDADAPMTGWGISDLKVLAQAAETVFQSSKASPPRIVQAMILSVTNHIPWDLPRDAPEFLKALATTHPSHKTTAYFDFALGEFVRALKAKNIWRDTLLIVSGDHGNFEPPRNTSYAERLPDRFELLASHINLVVSGGITEEIMSETGISGEMSQPVSQAQIAPFLAAVASYETEVFLDVPLFDESPWPVASDLNQYLYLPASHLKIPKEDVLAGNLDHPAPEALLAVTRYRGFLQLLFENE